MRAALFVLSVTELQAAVREYVEKHEVLPVDGVVVDNGYGKHVLAIPFAPGSVIAGEYFKRATELLA